MLNLLCSVICVLEGFADADCGELWVFRPDVILKFPTDDSHTGGREREREIDAASKFTE